MNFLGMGPMELVLILVLALIVFGPGKLPEMMSQLGRAWREFQRTTTDLSSEFNKTLQTEIDETKAAAEGRKSRAAEEAERAAAEKARLQAQPQLVTAPPAVAPTTNGSAAVAAPPADPDPKATGGDVAPPA